MKISQLLKLISINFNFLIKMILISLLKFPQKTVNHLSIINISYYLLSLYLSFSPTINLIVILNNHFDFLNLQLQFLFFKVIFIILKFFLITYSKKDFN